MSPAPNTPDETAPRWHSRRYIPHLEDCRAIQHVTFHLADSLPKKALEDLESKLSCLAPAERNVERRRRLEHLIDSGYGACWLERPDCAQIVQDSLLYFDDLRYKLLAWVIMPNHVHVLFETSADWEMSKIVASWKSWTAGKIAQIICASKGAAEVTGAVGTDLGHNLFARGRMQCPVWHREYWDRYIRDERHLTAAVAYIENNPVKAGLAKSPDSWPWGSARYRKSREANEMPDG